MQDEQVEKGYRALRAIRRMIRKITAHSRRLSADSGLTLPQLMCMRAIDELDLDEVTVAAVSDAVGLSRSTVSVVVEKLVQRELVTRDRSTRDRRRVHLGLTDAGLGKLGGNTSPLQDRFLARLSAMDDADQERILSTLEEVVAMMDAETIDAAPMLVPGVDLPKD